MKQFPFYGVITPFVLFLTLFLISQPLLSQSSMASCVAESSALGSSATCGDPCYAEMPTSDMTNLPLITVSVVFHFTQPTGSVNQFQCSNPSAPFFAPDFIQSLLDQANLAFSDPAANTFGSSPDIPDARIRYELLGNPVDPCDAIIFHNSYVVTTLVPGALNVVINYDNPASTNCSNAGSTTEGSSRINLLVSIAGYLMTDGQILQHLAHL